MAQFTVHHTDGSQRRVRARRVSQIGDRLVVRDEAWRTVCDLPGDGVTEVRRRSIESNGMERSITARYAIRAVGEER